MMNTTKQLKNGQEITVRTCTTADLSSILALQKEVIHTLTETSFLQPLTKEEFLHILSEHGMMLGAFHEGELIAFRALLIPNNDEADHLGEDAGINREEWTKVIYSEISNVKPSFRGNGLQRILGELIIGEIDSKQFRYVCATVAPFNIASLLDKFAHGLKVVSLKEKYEGLLRYILVKDFAEIAVEVTESIKVSMGDIAAQQEYLQAGWRGVAIEKHDEDWFVAFER